MGDGKNTRKPGWHSKRHETSEAHDAARARHRVTRGKFARQRRAATRLGLSFSSTATSEDLRAVLARANTDYAKAA